MKSLEVLNEFFWITDLIDERVALNFNVRDKENISGVNQLQQHEP